MGVRKLDSQKYMKFMGKVDLSLRLKFRIVDAQGRTLLVANQAQEEAEYAQQSYGNGSKNCVAFRNGIVI